ncbi:MAG: hypothetical protein RBS18_02975, partial [Clostridia bacterium]|nr:hypothetical protein [Clostridia bacterium]
MYTQNNDPNQPEGGNHYLHRQEMPEPLAPASPSAQKRKLFWPVFFAILLTASLTFVLTAAAGYIFYGDAVRKGIENSLGSEPGETDAEKPSGIEDRKSV